MFVVRCSPMMAGRRTLRPARLHIYGMTMMKGNALDGRWGFGPDDALAELGTELQLALDCGYEIDDSPPNWSPSCGG